MPSPTNKALAIIADQGGLIRTGEALAHGIHPRTLYALRDNRTLEAVARGLYRLANRPPLGDPDLALVAGRIPHGVICLISALAIHELTTQIPHRIDVAIPRTARYPVSAGAPMTIYRFALASYQAGVTQRNVDGVKIKIYAPEKTLADCFKYRNKIGLDVFLEALDSYCKRPRASMQKILEYARVDRVETRIRPYLEARA